MSKNGNISQRNQAFNTHLQGIINHYKEPLTQALIELRNVHGYTLEEVAERVFKNEISPDAVRKIYLKGVPQRTRKVKK